MERLLNYFSSFSRVEQHHSSGTTIINSPGYYPWHPGFGFSSSSKSSKEDKITTFLYILFLSLFAVWSFATDELVVFYLKNIDFLARREFTSPDIRQIYREWRRCALSRMTKIAGAKGVLFVSLLSFIWSFNLLNQAGVVLGASTWFWMFLIGRSDDECEACNMLTNLIQNRLSNPFDRAQ